MRAHLHRRIFSSRKNWTRSQRFWGFANIHSQPYELCYKLNFSDRCYRPRSSISRHNRKCAYRRHISKFMSAVRFRSFACRAACILNENMIFMTAPERRSTYIDSMTVVVLPANTFIQEMRTYNEEWKRLLLCDWFTEKKEIVRTQTENNHNGIDRNSSETKRKMGNSLAFD